MENTPNVPDDKKAYESNYREHGDADAHNEPPQNVDSVDPGYNPNPLPHRLTEGVIATETNIEGDEAGGI